MTADKVTRRVYSAEELHRLRGTCSQPKLREAIEQNDGDDADLVKEHILRGSKSFAARSFRSRTSGNSLRVPSNKENRSVRDTENSRQSSGQHEGNILGEIAPNGQVYRSGFSRFRPSPTPSLKKKKAEAIVKAHGSPQHVRVTAGGRIVPSDQSPLCHPRYGYSAIKVNGGLIKFAPNHPMGKAQWTEATQNGFVAQDINGRLCQIVNGTILPLNEIDGALRLYVPAPNLNITSRGSSFGPPAHGGIDGSIDQQRAPSQPKRIVPPEPSPIAQTNALELEYSKLERELKELDKTEVLHGRTMGKAAKDALIGKRRELVVTLDNIRKAIKSIKNTPPPEAPTSPRAMQSRQSMSPPRNRLPAFLQQRIQNNNMAMQPMQQAYGPVFSVAPPQQYNGSFGFQPLPSPDATFDNPSFALPPPAMFVPQPSFESSLVPAFLPFNGQMNCGVQGNRPLSTNLIPATDIQNADTQLPQTDGSRSVADLQKVSSPRQSRAIDIKAPVPKQTAALKSTLNPMSPAYKPGTGVLQSTSNTDKASAKSVKDESRTPLSPRRQVGSAAVECKDTNTTTATTSPTKKSPHLHSSSISSFETADFFPRNTREYSTRKYTYPESVDKVEDKENVSPVQQADNHDDHLAAIVKMGSTGKHHSAAAAMKMKASPTGGYEAPAPPPGTPVSGGPPVGPPRPTVKIDNDGTLWSRQSHEFDVDVVPDRETHNLSPKGRRQDYLFTHERPNQFTGPASSPADVLQSAHKDLGSNASPIGSIDFAEASTEWIEGYRAGLARCPVGSDRIGDFLDGYCAGLLKSKPATTANIGLSTGSPVKLVSRRPSPVAVQPRSPTNRAQLNRHDAHGNHSPFETHLQSMDSLKQAVFAPQNEDAILSPAPDGPHANEHPCNLGAWAKNRQGAAILEALPNSGGDERTGFPFPDRTSSMLKRQTVMSEADAEFKPKDLTIERHMQSSTGPRMAMPMELLAAELAGSAILQPPGQTPTAMKGINPGQPDPNCNRVSSMTSIDSNLYRQWPGHRVFSPHLEWKSATSVAQAAGLASGFFASAQFDGTPHAQQPPTDNSTMQHHGRFHEGSLDGMTSPPTSPQSPSPPLSPAMSPSAMPRDGSSKTSKKDTPKKGSSPAKVKFENIAEKVGIKASTNKKEDGSSPTSPPGKRRWRDVWRGSRKELSKDDSC